MAHTCKSTCRRLLLSGRGSKAWRPPNTGCACTSPHQGQRSHLDALGGLPQRAASPNAGGTPPPARGRTSAGGGKAGTPSRASVVGGRAGAPVSHTRGDGPPPTVPRRPPPAVRAAPPRRAAGRPLLTAAARLGSQWLPGRTQADEPGAGGTEAA